MEARYGKPRLLFQHLRLNEVGGLLWVWSQPELQCENLSQTNWAGEMAQWVRVQATKPENPSLIPKTLIMERIDS